MPSSYLIMPFIARFDKFQRPPLQVLSPPYDYIFALSIINIVNIDCVCVCAEPNTQVDVT